MSLWDDMPPHDEYICLLQVGFGPDGQNPEKSKLVGGKLSLGKPVIFKSHGQPLSYNHVVTPRLKGGVLVLEYAGEEYGHTAVLKVTGSKSSKIFGANVNGLMACEGSHLYAFSLKEELTPLDYSQSVGMIYAIPAENSLFIKTIALYCVGGRRSLGVNQNNYHAGSHPETYHEWNTNHVLRVQDLIGECASPPRATTMGRSVVGLYGSNPLLYSHPYPERQIVLISSPPSHAVFQRPQDTVQLSSCTAMVPYSPEQGAVVGRRTDTELAKIDTISKQLFTLENRVAKNEATADTLSANFGALKETTDQNSSELKIMSANVGVLKGDMSTLTNSMADLASAMTTLATDTQRHAEESSTKTLSVVKEMKDQSKIDMAKIMESFVEKMQTAAQGASSKSGSDSRDGQHRKNDQSRRSRSRSGSRGGYHKKSAWGGRSRSRGRDDRMDSSKEKHREYKGYGGTRSASLDRRIPDARQRLDMDTNVNQRDQWGAGQHQGNFKPPPGHHGDHMGRPDPHGHHMPFHGQHGDHMGRPGHHEDPRARPGPQGNHGGGRGHWDEQGRGDHAPTNGGGQR